MSAAVINSDWCFKQKR